MKSGHTVPALLNLVKRFDDLIAPAATRVLCSLLPEDDLRGMMLQLGVLSILLDMLERCSDQTKQVACHALVKFAQYDDIQHVMSRDGYLRKLAMRSQSHVQSKRGGAIIALVALGNARARVTAAVMEAIKAAKTIHILVTRLNQKSTALSAASALAGLVKIADDKCGAQIGIVGMLQRRWFDGLRGEDGLQVMSRLLECERLRLAVLKAGAVDVLCEMIDPGDYERTYAGLHYLRVVARFGVERSTLPTRELLSLASHVVNALRVPYWRVKRIAIEILSFLSAEEDLRTLMADGLLGLLGNRHAGVVFAASTLLGFLVIDKSVRDRLLMEEAFWTFSREYYEGLNIDYDEENGPCIGEAYESVRNMIKLILDFENGEVAVRDTVTCGQTGQPDCLNNFCNSSTCVATHVEQQSAERNRWFAHVPYEPEKNRLGGHWIMWRK
ncbi:armadillo-type protein [Boletus edulis BED1]|uniref:Armadillo-type protein n=1 Tax=Boletus edulis BED1 TaxID=1328754 RepID=A0AAD4BUA7_BOLED|nr:armadillo-type protein [Boletus edulis BED1]